MKQARDIMTKDIVTVHKQDRLENVLDLMRKHNISKIPVVDNGRLVGIVTDGTVLEEIGALKNRLMSPTTLHASGAMARKFDTVAPDDELKLVVAICKDEGVGLVPVVSGANGANRARDGNPGEPAGANHDLDHGRLEGIITKADLLPLVTGEEPLSGLMKRTLHSVHPTDRLIHARRMMIDHDVERLPVLDGGRLVGIVSEMDIALAIDDLKKRTTTEHQKNQLKNLYVQDAMVTQVVTARPDMPAREAARLMRARDIGCLPVVSDGDRIEGMVTRTDLIRLLA